MTKQEFVCAYCAARTTNTNSFWLDSNCKHFWQPTRLVEEKEFDWQFSQKLGLLFGVIFAAVFPFLFNWGADPNAIWRAVISGLIIGYILGGLTKIILKVILILALLAGAILAFGFVCEKFLPDPPKVQKVSK